jgi:SAM-dependent methyltransferase
VKNVSAWVPTKFVFRNGKLRASRDPEQVSPWSRLGSDVTARLYQAYLPKYCRGRLLDLGCGTVPFYEAYRPYIDDNLDFECDITQPLPIADLPVDTIILSDVLEHLPEPEKTWTEMARVLKSSGHVIMNVRFFYGLHEQPHDYYRYTEFALRRFARNAGFEVLVLEPTGGVPEIMTDLTAKTLRRLRAVGRWIGIVLQSACAAFVSTWLGRKISEATAEQFPAGYFMIARKL